MRKYLTAVQNNIWVEAWEQGNTNGYVHIDASVLTAASASSVHLLNNNINADSIVVLAVTDMYIVATPRVHVHP